MGRLYLGVEEVKGGFFAFVKPLTVGGSHSGWPRRGGIVAIDLNEGCIEETAFRVQVLRRKVLIRKVNVTVREESERARSFRAGLMKRSCPADARSL